MSTPFDLHVLSTPPAFILSQDQTLNKMVSTQAFRLELICFIEAKSLASKNCQGPSIQAFACSEGLSSFLVLRVSFTLFNLQGARR